jgi:exonuclease III
MLRVLFWNIKGRDTRTALRALEYVPALVRRFEPHVLTLIESPASAGARLQKAGLRLELVDRRSQTDRDRGLSTFCLDERLRLTQRGDDRYHRAYQAVLPGHQPLTLVAVHLPSALHDKGDHDQARRRADLCRAFVERTERDAGHTRTAVYGDFNMNPFAHAMVNFDGLNAMSTAFRARRARTLSGVTRATFYNPMWSLLGDRRLTPDGRVSPAGTYYMDDEGPAGYFWHMPDQVLVRFELCAHLRHLDIIDEVESRLLVSNDARKPAVSDHLPVLVEFNQTVWTEVSQ